MVISGVGECIYVFDECVTYVTQHVSGVKMLRMLSYGHKRFGGVGGGGGGLYSRLLLWWVRHFRVTYHFWGRLWGKSRRTIVAGAQQMDVTWKHLQKWRPMSMLHQKDQQLYKKRYTRACSWTWRHNVALLQSVSSALPEASRRETKGISQYLLEMIGMIKNHKSLMFFWKALESKIASPRRRNASFYTWVTRLPIEMNCHITNRSGQVLQIPAFYLLASKILIKNSAPLQVFPSRLPIFSRFWWVFGYPNRTIPPDVCKALSVVEPSSWVSCPWNLVKLGL